MTENIILPPTGRVRAALMLPDNVYYDEWRTNLVLREWGAIVARALAMGGTEYRINGMYIEFANSGTSVTPPSYDRDPASGKAYYDGLAGHPNRDYLRVSTLTAEVSSSDETLYPLGNLNRFFAMTSGTTGVHGKPFSDVANSRVIGAALVAMPVIGDPTRDFVFSRFYYDQSEQKEKPTTGQIGLQWELTYG